MGCTSSTHRDDAFIDGLLRGRGDFRHCLLVCYCRVFSSMRVLWKGWVGLPSQLSLGGHWWLWLCGEGRDVVMHQADLSSCFLSGETMEQPRLGSSLGRGGISPAACNPWTWWQWLDPAPKDTSAAGGSIQSGPRPPRWWSLLGSGIHLLWAASEPVSSNLRDSLKRKAPVLLRL